MASGANRQLKEALVRQETLIIDEHWTLELRRHWHSLRLQGLTASQTSLDHLTTTQAGSLEFA